MRTIKLTSGPAAGETLEVESDRVIGRDNADLTIADPELSRHHAVLRPVEDGVEVEDLGSLNGTYVNGERIGGPVRLVAGAKLRVGGSEAELEISLPRAEARPDVTAPRVIPQPDLTAPRAVPAEPEPPAAAGPPAEPDLTAMRPSVPQPEVTAQRPVAPEPEAPAVAQPDVTAPRPVIPRPDVTAERPARSQRADEPPPIPQPDVTAPRPVAAQPDVTALRSAAPAEDSPPRAPAASRDGLPPAALVALGVLIGAVIVVIVVLLA